MKRFGLARAKYELGHGKRQKGLAGPSSSGGKPCEGAWILFVDCGELWTGLSPFSAMFYLSTPPLPQSPRLSQSPLLAHLAMPIPFPGPCVQRLRWTLTGTKCQDQEAWLLWPPFAFLLLGGPTSTSLSKGSLLCQGLILGPRLTCDSDMVPALRSFQFNGAIQAEKLV